MSHDGQAGRDITPLAESGAGVALWRCDLDARARRAATLAHSLSSGEQARAARFGTDALRDRWIAGRTALRELLAAVLHVAPAEVPLRRGRRGRPEIAIDGAPDFNVSHTAAHAIVAIGIAVAPGVRVGVDVERRSRQLGADRLARKFLTATERASFAGLDADARRHAFLRAWTYKEAMSKATADGLIAPFRAIDIDRGAPRVVAGPPPYSPSSWQLFEIDAGAELFAALALWRSDDANIAARDAM